MPQITRWLGTEPETLRHYLQEGSDETLPRHRGTVFL
jgi:hypothetical protein